MKLHSSIVYYLRGREGAKAEKRRDEMVEI